MERGKFITLEGIEGVGKSTVLSSVIDVCVELGKHVKSTREPGGTDIAEQFRKILLTTHSEIIDYKTELLMLFAGRAQHVSQVIEPALQEGVFVVSDRFVDATYAYQGAGRGIEFSSIDSLVRLVHPNLVPDLTLLLDAPLSVCLDRLTNRTHKDRFEKEDHKFFENVRECYLDRAAAEPERIIIIDANQSKKQVVNSIRNEIHRAFK